MQAGAEEGDSNQLPRANRVVLEAARSAGIEIEIRRVPAGSRTAEDAAAACGTHVSRIVKSLIFRGEDSGRAILLLVSGSNRVDESLVSESLGESIIRPDASFVRDATGFAIGGIPPFGHASALDCWIDEDLLQYESVFAAAGTPDSLFSISPSSLVKASRANRLRVAKPK